MEAGPAECCHRRMPNAHDPMAPRVQHRAIGFLMLLALAVSGCSQGRSQNPAGMTWTLDPNLNPTTNTTDFAQTLLTDPDVQRVNAEIEAQYQAALAQMNAGNLDPYHQVITLGKLLLYDKTLSVAKNQACTSCHIDFAGFTGGVELWNRTTVAYAGSVAITNATLPAPNYRVSARKPQTYGYAPFAPILQFRQGPQDLYGGNFWDMRATGHRLGNPAAEQALGPPTNPVEMGLPDPACWTYRISQTPYRPLFEQIYGVHSFAITWPANVEQVCSTPGPAPASDPLPVQLSPVDRAIALDTMDRSVTAIAAYEASKEVSPFSSKFDAFLNGNAQLTAQEQRGYDLFRNKAKCNQCHLDGSETGPVSANQQPADVSPFFTDFTSVNIGVPANLALPYLYETAPDQYGYVANPAGTGFVDLGVGAFLASVVVANPSLTQNPNPSDWAALAPKYNGNFRVPTLRNVDKRPRPGFVKAYMHNGYLKSLKEVVHFYNTSQALPRCQQGSPGENVTCWPPPAVSENLNTTQVGNLGLTDEEENDIVAFLQTLTDGYQP
jgi:cytochrome c peroxidase